MPLSRNTSLFKYLSDEGVLRPGNALDLGCGLGKDARIFAEAGFIVDAVDKDATSIKAIEETKGALKINGTVSVLQDFIIKPNYYSLVSAQYSLQFTSKEATIDIVRRMTDGCVSGGVIAFTLIGERDEWKDKWSTWTRNETEKLVSDLPVKTHKMIEEEGTALTKAGPLKWWHVFTFVLIKK